MAKSLIIRCLLTGSLVMAGSGVSNAFESAPDILSGYGGRMASYREKPWNPILVPGEGGVITGGGGTVVYLKSNPSLPILLDLFVKDPNLTEPVDIESYFIESEYELSDGEIRPFHLNGMDFGSFYENGGSGEDIDCFSLEWDGKFCPLERLAKKLKTWERSSPVTVHMVLDTIKNTQYYYTDNDTFKSRFSTRTDYVIPDHLKVLVDRTETLVYYDPIIGPVVNLDILKKMKMWSQMGWFVHEAFRQIQRAYDERISDLAVQDLTARIVLTIPQKNHGQYDRFSYFPDLDYSLDNPNVYGLYFEFLNLFSMRGGKNRLEGLCARLELAFKGGANDKTIESILDNECVVVRSDPMGEGALYSLWTADQNETFLTSSFELNQNKVRNYVFAIYAQLAHQAEVGVDPSSAAIYAELQEEIEMILEVSLDARSASRIPDQHSEMVFGR